MKINWTAVAAIGTFLAVFWAIYHQEIKSWIDRPKIVVDWFEPSDPHLIVQKGASYEKNGYNEYDGVFITLQLINTGKRTAFDAEVQLTNVAKKTTTNTWQIENNWIPIPLKWVLGRNRLQRDLVPERSYLVNLSSFSSARDGQLLITYTMSPRSQRETFEPGEYCFEVSVFATGATKIKKYVFVTFENFGDNSDPIIIQNYIKRVDMKSMAPW